MIGITQAVVQYLGRCLPNPVSAEIPERAAGEFVVVAKLGGGEKNRISESSVRISCYADSLANAENLSGEVQAAMDNMVFLPEVSAVEYGGDYNATENKKYCFEVMYTITHY